MCLDFALNEDNTMIHELYAYISVADATAAIEFYVSAFGAEEMFRLTEPGGRVGHAQLKFGPHVLMLAEQFPEHGILAPPDITGPRYATLHLHVDNCDAMIARAVELGATLEREPTDEFYGERGGAVRCPFGHRWLIGHSIEEVAPEEMQRRYDAFFE